MSNKDKIREIIVYLIVGVLTTIVSWGACFVAKLCGLDSENDLQNFIINTIGWVVGVLFAYPLNRKWVFKSTNPKIMKEFFGFAASRLGTWILDIVIMFVFINVWRIFLPASTYLHEHISFLGKMNLDDVHYWFVKICISAVLVTILNYVFSKVLIFSKKKSKGADSVSDETISEAVEVKPSKEKFVEEGNEKKPVIKCSICNGEQVAGFVNAKTGAFEECNLIRNDKDLEEFRRKYGIEGEIEKIY